MPTVWGRTTCSALASGRNVKTQSNGWDIKGVPFAASPNDEPILYVLIDHDVVWYNPVGMFQELNFDCLGNRARGKRSVLHRSQFNMASEGKVELPAEVLG